MVSKARDGGSDSRLEEIVSEGNHRASLEALRDELARSMANCEPSVVAQVASQLRATLKEIAALPDAKKATKHDELARKRADRRAATAAAALAAGEGN